MPVMRLLIRLCVLTGGLTLGGCHYTEEQKWSVCCVLYVRADPLATNEARTVIGWHRQSDYDGNGRGGQGYYAEGKTYFSDKDDNIRADVAAFLDDNPEKRPTEYFVGLAMICGSYSTASGTAGTRCQIALPVRVICGATYRFLPGTTPIPEQLKRPRAGVLHVSVDLPTGKALKTSSHVDPTPGEQLCHR
jgi:hypothetical protein